MCPKIRWEGWKFFGGKLKRALDVSTVAFILFSNYFLRLRKNQFLKSVPVIFLSLTNFIEKSNNIYDESNDTNLIL